MTNEPTKMKLDALQAEREVGPLSPLPIPESELCTRYEALSTPMVNDVLREQGYLYQTLPTGILPLRDEMRVAGLAFTIKGAKILEN